MRRNRAIRFYLWTAPCAGSQSDDCIGVGRRLSHGQDLLSLGSICRDASLLALEQIAAHHTIRQGNSAVLSDPTEDHFHAMDPANL